MSLMRPLAVLALLFSTSAVLAAERYVEARETAIERLVDSAGTVDVSPLDLATAYTRVRATGSRPLLAGQKQALEQAGEFLSRFGDVAGVRDPGAELELLRISTDVSGKHHVHFSQRYAGLPVFGARLVVHQNASGIYGMNGVFVPDLDGLLTVPTVTDTQVRAMVLGMAHKLHPDDPLAVRAVQLMVYRSGLLEGHVGKNYLAWEVEVASAAMDVRERYYINAAGGGLINLINLVHSFKNRAIYTPSQVTPTATVPVANMAPPTAPVPPVLVEKDPAGMNPLIPPLADDDRSKMSLRLADAPVRNLYVFAGGTYDLYFNLFGRGGYDDGARLPEEQVQKSVYLVNDRCPNAYWNGDSTNYCPGFDGDDVVSHEWSHAYTEYTHGLVYQYQSGALNEAYSDIFGETYDLVNGIEGPLGASYTEGDYYENGGSRWVVGEDLSLALSLAFLRDMWDPDAYGYVPTTQRKVLNGPCPGSVISSPNFYCGTDQSTLVHTNSGVPNHAYAMLVDGKTFNGVTVPGIGLLKAAHIYFHAENNYQTPTTNFAQHADALEQSCKDLIGKDLNGFDGLPSGQIIGKDDCAAVAAAMLAVEMRQNPNPRCNYQPLLLPEKDTPKACKTGAETVDFKEDWEKGIPQGWVQTQNLAGDKDPQPFEWVLVEAPAPHKGKAVFADDLSTGGGCSAGNDISSSFALTSPEIEIKDDKSFLKFAHYVQTENGFDGGNLKASVNGGPFTLVPKSAFVHNGYNSTFGEGPTIPGVPDPTGIVNGNNTNPMAGQDAWTGSDQGESSGSWGVSIVEIAVVGANKGDKVQFRYEFGQDGCGGNLGWYVDEVSVFHCGDGKALDETAGPISESVVSAQREGRGFLLGGAFGPWLLAGLMLAALRRKTLTR